MASFGCGAKSSARSASLPPAWRGSRSAFLQEACLCTLSSMLGQLLFCCFFACPFNPLLTCSVVCMITLVYLDSSGVWVSNWVQACTRMPVTALSWVVNEDICICHHDLESICCRIMPRPCMSSIQAFDALSMQFQSHPHLLGLALGLISLLKWRGSEMFIRYL